MNCFSHWLWLEYPHVILQQKKDAWLDLNQSPLTWWKKIDNIMIRIIQWWTKEPEVIVDNIDITALQTNLGLVVTCVWTSFKAESLIVSKYSTLFDELLLYKQFVITIPIHTITTITITIFHDKLITSIW